MSNLYALSAEYQAASDRLHDMELDDQTIVDTLEGMVGDIEEKWKNIIFVVRNLNAMAEARKAAAKTMLDMAASEIKRAAYLQDLVLQSMILVGRNKADCTFFKLAVRDNPYSVIVTNEEKIPDKYKRIIPATSAPDKIAIKEALLAGEVIESAHLVRIKSLSIK